MRASSDPGGYALRVTVPDRAAPHRAERCAGDFLWQSHSGGSTGAAGCAVLHEPKHCSGEPLTTTLRVDSWEHPAAVPLDARGALDFARLNFGELQWKSSSSSAPGVTGCGGLHSTRRSAAQFETAAADEPTGLMFDLRVPQAPAGAWVRRRCVLRGWCCQWVLVSNAGVADGLAGCSDAQIALASAAAGSCPEASQMGTWKSIRRCWIIRSRVRCFWVLLNVVRVRLGMRRAGGWCGCLSRPMTRCRVSW